MRYKIFVLIGILLVFLLPKISFAANFRSADKSITITESETLNDDLYIASGDVTIDGKINGDLYIAGGNVSVNGTVTEDVNIVGGQVSIDGIVNDDLRVVGGNVSITGQVDDDFFAWAGQIEIDENAVILGEVVVGSSQVIISGQIGPVKATVSSIIIDSTAKVNGDVRYVSAREAIVKSGSQISGNINRTDPQFEQGDFAALATTGKIISLIVTLILALVFLGIFPIKSNSLATDWQKNFWLNLLWGFLFLIAVPILIVLLLITIIGIPLALGIMFLYIILIYLGTLVGVISLGTWIANLTRPVKEAKVNWLAIIIGVIIMEILDLIPIFGGIANFIIILVGLGALIKYDWNLYNRLRAEKEI